MVRPDNAPFDIPFNRPALTGREIQYLAQALEKGKLSGDGEFSARCHQWLMDHLPCRKALLTTSCTHALEISALLAGIEAGDEVIMPSYTFVSTANAFVLRGAKVVFVDIRPDTMNIDEKRIEAAVTERTKAVVPVHYGGVACEMETILSVAAKYGLIVIEDAAQAVLSTYRGRPLGTLGHLGCFSFHDTKNVHCGEGGALLVNDERFAEKAEIIREKGTNRSKFLRGQVDKYTWVDLGSSYLPSELNAAFLLAQLEGAGEITAERLAAWHRYYEGLSPLADRGCLELPVVPEECSHNAGLFFVKVRDQEERRRLMNHLQKAGAASAFHYIPLHASTAGQKFGRFHGDDVYTTQDSLRLVRLPLYYGIRPGEIDWVVEQTGSFFGC